MKVEFGSKILDIDGKVVKDGDKDMTLGSISCTALLLTFPDEQNLDGEAKVKRFRLAEKAVKGDTQELSAGEVTELKKLIAKAFGPLVVGRAYELIEPDVT